MSVWMENTLKVLERVRDDGNEVVELLANRTHIAGIVSPLDKALSDLSTSVNLASTLLGASREPDVECECFMDYQSCAVCRAAQQAGRGMPDDNDLAFFLGMLYDAKQLEHMEICPAAQAATMDMVAQWLTDWVPSHILETASQIGYDRRIDAQERDVHEGIRQGKVSG